MDRDFTAPAPHPLGRGLHLLRDLGGFVYVAFVVDVFAQRIVGWHAATTKVTDVVLTPLRIALWDRDRLVITAITTPGLSQAETVRTDGLSQAWVSRLIAGYRVEGEAAFDRAHDDPRPPHPGRCPSRCAT